LGKIPGQLPQAAVAGLGRIQRQAGELHRPRIIKGGRQQAEGLA
jgi:hypothetical protein